MPKILDKKYLQSHRMTFLTFEYLLQELTPYINPTSTEFVKAPIHSRKIVIMVLYQLAHRLCPVKMSALYGVGY